LLYYGDGIPDAAGVKTQWNIYDPYLYIHNTSCDVHLIGKEPLPYSQNPNEEHVIHIDPQLPEVIIDQALLDELETMLEEFFPNGTP